MAGHLSTFATLEPGVISGYLTWQDIFLEIRYAQKTVAGVTADLVRPAFLVLRTIPARGYRPRAAVFASRRTESAVAVTADFVLPRFSSAGFDLWK